MKGTFKYSTLQPYLDDVTGLISLMKQLMDKCPPAPEHLPPILEKRGIDLVLTRAPRV